MKAAALVTPLTEVVSNITTTFAQMPFHDRLKQIIVRRGYTSPTHIQQESIPHVLAGRDVVGIANTGTGKTGAFLLPLLERMHKGETKKTIIIVPTRELALQIQEELKAFTFGMQVWSAVCIGGGSMNYQMRDLRRRPAFVIGTPGRLMDFIERGVLKMQEFDTAVLDEVDRMVDMGFIKDITHILSLLPEKRQSLFYSATITPEVSRTIERFAKDPITISVRTQETSDHVEQDVVHIQPGDKKFDVLEKLLEKDEFEKVLVFGRTKHGVERLARDLYAKNFKVDSIHGDKPQRKREQAIRLFKSNVISVLVATDVAARGLDISDVTHVINFDEPATYDDYIHRIGRTGRAGKRGCALTFVQR